MRIGVQQMLMKPPTVYMNKGHSFCVFLFIYITMKSNKLFNDFLLHVLDLVIFCIIIFELYFTLKLHLGKILMLKFDIKYFLSKESGYHMISIRTYSYLKKIKMFLDMYLCSKGRVFSVVVHEILLV